MCGCRINGFFQSLDHCLVQLGKGLTMGAARRRGQVRTDHEQLRLHPAKLIQKFRWRIHRRQPDRSIEFVDGAVAFDESISLAHPAPAD